MLVAGSRALCLQIMRRMRLYLTTMPSHTQMAPYQLASGAHPLSCYQMYSCCCLLPLSQSSCHCMLHGIWQMLRIHCMPWLNRYNVKAQHGIADDRMLTLAGTALSQMAMPSLAFRRSRQRAMGMWTSLQTYLLCSSLAVIREPLWPCLGSANFGCKAGCKRMPTS